MDPLGKQKSKGRRKSGVPALEEAMELLTRHLKSF